MKKFIIFITAALVMVSTLAIANGPVKSNVGEVLYNMNCAKCHGKKGVGSVIGSGPPLVHKIYEPSHHGDASFHMAVVRGVRAHHWGFGNMKPVAGLDRAEVETIISYIRGLQREAGIF